MDKLKNQVQNKLSIVVACIHTTLNASGIKSLRKLDKTKHIDFSNTKNILITLNSINLGDLFKLFSLVILKISVIKMTQVVAIN